MRRPSSATRRASVASNSASDSAAIADDVGVNAVEDTVHEDNDAAATNSKSVVVDNANDRKVGPAATPRADTNAQNRQLRTPITTPTAAMAVAAASIGISTSSSFLGDNNSSVDKNTVSSTTISSHISNNRKDISNNSNNYRADHPAPVSELDRTASGGDVATVAVATPADSDEAYIDYDVFEET